MSVTVVIPHVPVPERETKLQRAISSVQHQTQRADEILVCPDHNHDGPGATRTRGLANAKSDWVVYLDDDDWLHPEYIERCVAFAKAENADLVYPWFSVNGGTDPFPKFFGKPWDSSDPHIFPVTYLVRKSIALQAGGFPTIAEMGDAWAEQWNGSTNRGGEDWHALLRLIGLGAKIVHLPERLWTWDHLGTHYSGGTW